LRSERGNVTLIVLAGVGLALILSLGVARVGSAVLLQSRADGAADAAALAGADALALGRSSAAAIDAARAAASDNGARLINCACSGNFAEVTVEIVGRERRARGYARAEVDLSRAPAHAP
jgi:secretion/DNA translocation related TadE-like protein